MIEFPCMDVQLVPVNKIIVNDYHPGSMALPERRLLIRSIEKDGVTQPIVAHYDPQRELYVVITGTQRFVLLRDYFKCEHIPVVVIQMDDIKDRMASTARHHLAMSKWQIEKTSELIRELIVQGWTDDRIARELSMEAEAILRLKWLTGLTSLFRDQPYSKAWVKSEK